MKRIDIHRPSAINPNEYAWVAFECINIGGSGDIIGDCHFILAERNRIREHMKQTGGTYSGHEHGGNCMVCGSVNAIYTVLFFHSLTNTYVRMGQDCAQKCEMSYSDGMMSAFRTSAKNALDLHAGKRKAQAILAREGLSACWTLYIDKAEGKEEYVVSDIVGKVVQYGSISIPQAQYLRSLLNQITNRAAILAQRQAQADAAAPVPTGRFDIEGLVLVIKASDGMYGGFKMLVVHDKGWKVWGTAPSKVEISKGDRIAFTATVKQANNDTKFGYFSRPTGTKVLSVAIS